MPVYLKDSLISQADQPNLKLLSSGNTYTIFNPTGSTPALYVTLESDTPGYFSDNVFQMLPGEEVTVRFVKKEEGVKEVVRVRSYN